MQKQSLHLVSANEWLTVLDENGNVKYDSCSVLLNFGFLRMQCLNINTVIAKS